VQPSSLVFVVVIAIWAAYLVQYWVRRREHMSTARSVDRFSRAMRVLERRSPSAQPEADAAPAVRPALVARASSSGAMPATPPQHRPQRPHRRPRRLVRLLRAAGLLLATSAVAATLGLAIAGIAPWWTTGVALSALGLCLVTLRVAAVREQTARHTERSMRAAGSTSRKRPDEAFDHDVDEHEAAPTGAAGHPAYRPGDPTWRPVPVPRPTYQLKDPAPQARPEGGASSPQPSEPEQPQSPTSQTRHAVGG